ncbi:MAG: HPP family protein [Methylococcales bacterium]|nr:HPP family protein [Methylococcales bacterium]
MVSYSCNEIISGPGKIILVASLGASTVIIFAIPNSPVAQPWACLGGQVISAFTGVSIGLLFPDPIYAAAFAVGVSTFLMLLLRCLHPPGAATALAPIVASDQLGGLGFNFVLVPVGLNILILLILALIINRWILNRDYPSGSKVRERKQEFIDQESIVLSHVGILDEDLKTALAQHDGFIDVTSQDLTLLFNQMEALSFQRKQGAMLCRDIMVTEIPTVEFGTDIEAAWNLLHTQLLRALPVLDRTGRVIGIVTRNDFLKSFDLKPYASFQQRFKNFIHKTGFLHSEKPEAVGQIMSNKVAIISADEPIVSLIPLMVQQLHKQVPIVDNQNRLVGIVYCNTLIATLYNRALYGDSV